MVLGVFQEVVAEGVGSEVHWVSSSGSRRKRIRLNTKTPAHLVCHMEHSYVFIPDRKRRRSDLMMGDTFLLRSGLEWVNSWGLIQAHVSRFACF